MNPNNYLYGLKEADVEVFYPILQPHISVPGVARRSDYHGDYYSFDFPGEERLTLEPNHYWEYDDGTIEYVRPGFEDYKTLIEVHSTLRPQYWHELLKKIFPDLVLLYEYK